jgi:sortase A
MTNPLEDLREYGAKRVEEVAALAEGDPARYVALISLVVVAVLALGFCVEMALLSRLEYRAAQARSFSRLRNQLALGSAPVSQLDRRGYILRNGTPVALLEIPKLHLRAVVGEGSTPQVLMDGPGLLRSTVLPGQAGLSVILGRAAAYGGPFHSVGSLRKGDRVTVTTGAGRSVFAVIDVRRAGDPMPPPLADGAARLTLVTASGLPFLPSGLLRVDADLTTQALPAAAAPLPAVPRSEQPLGTDTSNLWVLVLLLQALVAASVAAVWSWQRWGHAQTWIVFFPLFSLLGYFTTDQFARFLPNVM